MLANDTQGLFGNLPDLPLESFEFFGPFCHILCHIHRHIYGLRLTLNLKSKLPAWLFAASAFDGTQRALDKRLDLGNLPQSASPAHFIPSGHWFCSFHITTLYYLVI